MTAASLPAAPPSGAGRLTYARARLWLGITGVGAMVVLAAAALLLDLPGQLLAADPAQPLPAAVGQVVLAMLVPVALLVPLDVLGGRVVVRDRRPAGAWLAGWGRGVVAQLAVWAGSAALLLAAGRLGGAWNGRAGAVAGALAGLLVAQLALLLARPLLARLVGGLRVRRVDPAAPADAWLTAAARSADVEPARLRVVDAGDGDALDTGFTGGWAGIAPVALLVPAHWAELAPDALAAQLARRQAVARAGLHTRGVLGALLFNVVGAGLVLGFAPGADATTAAGLVTLVAWATLWSFAGALVLPTPSRAAVYAADAAAAERVGAPAVRAAVAALDRWQDDEAERAPAVEAVFHPVPARGRRLARLADATPVAGAPAGGAAAHQLARHALFLAWGTLSPLARAVHCNVGRPALWVFWPGD
jgi:hypothetical protein